MLGGSITLFVLWNIMAVIVVGLMMVVFVLYRKYRMYYDMYKKYIEPKKDDGKNSSGRPMATATYESGLADLKRQIELRDVRIGNLEKFKKLYLSIDRMVREESKNLFDSVIKIVNYVKRGNDRDAVLLEAESSVNILKKMNPFLDQVKSGTFSLDEMAEFDPSDTLGQADDRVKKQKIIIERLREELSESRENEMRLKQLENHADKSAQIIKELKFKLEKEYATKRVLPRSGKTIAELQKRIQIMERRYDEANEEKLNLIRQVEHFKKTEGVGAVTPKDILVSEYVQSLTQEIANKQKELIKAKEDYWAIEKEFCRLFENSRKAASVSESAAAAKAKEADTIELKIVESDMSKKGRKMKTIEKELVVMTETCDEVIDLQSKYDRLKTEYKMLSDSIERNIQNQEEGALKAKINALNIENEHYREIEKKYDETRAELNRLRTEYSMIEEEYIALLEAK